MDVAPLGRCRSAYDRRIPPSGHGGTSLGVVHPVIRHCEKFCWCPSIDGVHGKTNTGSYVWGPSSCVPAAERDANFAGEPLGLGEASAN